MVEAYPETYVSKRALASCGVDISRHQISSSGVGRADADCLTVHRFSPEDWNKIFQGYLEFCQLQQKRLVRLHPTYRFHVCSCRCQFWSKQWSDVYFCSESGNFHYCTVDHCTSCRDVGHSRVCKLTNRVHPSRLMYATQGAISVEYGHKINTSDHMKAITNQMLDDRDENESTGADHGTESNTRISQEEAVSRLMRWMRDGEGCMETLNEYTKPRERACRDSNPSKLQQNTLVASKHSQELKQKNDRVNEKTRKRRLQSSTNRSAKRRKGSRKKKYAVRLSRFANMSNEAVGVDRRSKYLGVFKKALSNDLYRKTNFNSLVLMCEILWQFAISCPYYAYKSLSYRPSFHCLVVLELSVEGCSVEGVQLIPQVPGMDRYMKTRSELGQHYKVHFITKARNMFNEFATAALFAGQTNVIEDTAEALSKLKFEVV